MKEKITRYKAAFTRKDLKKARVRAAFLSDAHNSPWSGGVPAVMNQLARCSPDVVLVGGDMMTARPGADFSYAVKLLREVSAVFPVFYAFGNHEYRADLYREVYGDLFDRYTDALADTGIFFLRNESARLNINGQDVEIYGLEIPRVYYKRLESKKRPLNVGDYLEKPEEGVLSVLLAHSPKYLEEYFAFGCDLTLCGHYHGGIVGLSGSAGLIDPDLKLITKRARGKFSEDDHVAVVSAGMGDHMIPFRLNNPREIVMIDIATYPGTSGEVL